MLLLPHKPEALTRALNTIVMTGQAMRAPLSVEWTMNYRYLQGIRAFKVLSWRLGHVKWGWDTGSSEMPFRYDEIVEHFQRELGHLLKLKLDPLVKESGATTLDGVRKKAAAQVYLDHLMRKVPLPEVATALFEGGLLYGTMGIALDRVRGAREGLRAAIEVVPPWQLIPVPVQAMLTGGTPVRALIRDRYRPYSLLREMAPHLTFPSKDSVKNLDPKLEARWSAWGQAPDEASAPTPEETGVPSPVAPGSLSPECDSPAGRPEGEPFVHCTEYWLYDDQGRVLRQIVKLGRHVAQDNDYIRSAKKEEDARVANIGGASVLEVQAKAPLMSLAVVRSGHSGAFYSVPFVSTLISLNNKIELMLKNLFRNMEELDVTPMLLVPANRGIKREALSSKQRPRMSFYEQDYTSDKLAIEQIQSTNIGPLPGKIAEMALGISDRISRNNPILRGEAPGRVDSAAGLGFLYETGNTPRNPYLTSVESGLGTVYRALLGSAPMFLKGENPTLRLESVDDRLAGISFDPATGKLSPDDSPIPDPWDVGIGIRDKEPRFATQRRQELIGMLNAQILDKIGFVWQNWILGMEFPAGNEEIVESIKIAMWRNLVQYNDGKEPRKLVIGGHDRHDIHIMVVARFIRSFACEVAEPAVRDALYGRLEEHQAAGGGNPNFAAQLPYPEDAAMQSPAPSGLPPALESAIAREQQRAGAGQGGPPPQ